METKTTDQKIISMPLQRFISMLFGIVLATNTVSLTIQRLNNLEEKVKYNEEANRRRISNSEKETEYKYTISELEKELKECGE